MQILVDSNHQEFAMKQKRKKDVVDVVVVVSFDLIGLLPTNHYLRYLQIMAYQSQIWQMDALQYYVIR